MVNMERPGEFNEHLLRFLQSMPGEGESCGCQP
jgi:hypothetical protein